jgi:hypothetical protein
MIQRGNKTVYEGKAIDHNHNILRLAIARILTLFFSEISGFLKFFDELKHRPNDRRRDCRHNRTIEKRHNATDG